MLKRVICGLTSVVGAAAAIGAAWAIISPPEGPVYTADGVFWGRDTVTIPLITLILGLAMLLSGIIVWVILVKQERAARAE